MTYDMALAEYRLITKLIKDFKNSRKRGYIEPIDKTKLGDRANYRLTDKAKREFLS